MKFLTSVLVLVAATMGLCACGGGGGGSGGSTPPATSNASPGGIWQGTDPLTSQSLVGLVTEAGAFHFIEANGTQYIGSVTVTGTSFTGSFDGYTAAGTTFADGSTHGTGTMSGTVQARSSFQAATQFRTDNGSSTSDTLSLTFDSLYNTPSSLAAIAGNYTDANTGTPITISSSGTVFGQSAATGCVINGTVAIIDPSYDAYQFAISFASCQGSYAVLNGASFSGIGAINASATPVSIIIGYDGTAEGQTVAIVEILNQT